MAITVVHFKYTALGITTMGCGNTTVLLVAKDSQLLRKGFFYHTVYICITLINECLHSIYSISMKVLLLLILIILFINIIHL